MVYAPSKERTFELTNTGEFHFNYTLSGRRTASRRRRSAARQGGLDPAAAGGSVQLGRFTITPGSGVVMPQAARRRSWSNRGGRRATAMR